MSHVPLQPRQPGRSPFDAIRQVHTDPGGRVIEQWSARALAAELRYTDWRTFVVGIERAKAACRNTGHEIADHFVVHHEMIPIGKGGTRQVEDVLLSRLACYLVAMNGNPLKPEIAAAQRYFAYQTFRAEQLLPPASEPTPPPPAESVLTWATRFRRTFNPHVRDLHNRHPGCFTVVSAVVAEILTIEDEVVRHLMTTRAFDRPDVSIGLTYCAHRRAIGLPEVVRAANLFLPDQDRLVPVNVYDGQEWPVFMTWFRSGYLPNKLPAYLDRKPELRPYPAVTRASTADNACRELTGRPANLPAARRAALAAAGGFVPARALPDGPLRPQLGR